MPGRGGAASTGTASAVPASAGGAAGGTLYVVATPIGNLADITLRALEVLASVPLIAAEDTRMTRRLLARHEIDGRLVSFHARSAPARMGKLLSHLRGGADLAVVTDAGTPGVSDPGEELVAAWAAEGGRAVPIPGASAVLAAVAASGIAGPRWSFEGFLPRSGRERRRRLERIAADERATVLFEAPTRLARTLRDLAAACGPGRACAVCRELTKVHEQIVRGTLDELAAAVAAGAIQRRGEIVLVVGAGRPASRVRGTSASPANTADGAATGGSDRDLPGGDDVQTALDEARAAVDALVATGVARGDAARRIAAQTGLPRRALYRVDAEPT